MLYNNLTGNAIRLIVRRLHHTPPCTNTADCRRHVVLTKHRNSRRIRCTGARSLTRTRFVFSADARRLQCRVSQVRGACVYVILRSASAYYIFVPIIIIRKPLRRHCGIHSLRSRRHRQTNFVCTLSILCVYTEIRAALYRIVLLYCCCYYYANMYTTADND